MTDNIFETPENDEAVVREKVKMPGMIWIVQIFFIIIAIIWLTGAFGQWEHIAAGRMPVYLILWPIFLLTVITLVIIGNFKGNNSARWASVVLMALMAVLTPVQAFKEKNNTLYSQEEIRQMGYNPNSAAYDQGRTIGTVLFTIIFAGAAYFLACSKRSKEYYAVTYTEE